MNWAILTGTSLTPEAISAVRGGTAAALYWPGFVDASVADRLAEAMLGHESRRNYQARWTRQSGTDNVFSSTDTDRVGPVDTTPEGTSRAEEVVDALRWQRSVVAPALGPIDRLRLELDEALPGGAGLMRREGRLLLAGVGRVMEHSDVAVHADAGRKNCLTANVYLRVPPKGGGTTVWQFHGAYRHAGRSYLFQPGEIPDDTPAVSFQPEAGDLVIWDPTRPHAVLPFDGGVRVTVQIWVHLAPDAEGDLRATVLTNRGDRPLSIGQLNVARVHPLPHRHRCLYSVLCGEETSWSGRELV